ncbi:MAG: hypothetical protein QXX17_07735 [Conexivisphaerales archaeon]
MDTKLLSVRTSYYRSSIKHWFAESILETCDSKLVVLADGRLWYPWPLERYGLKWIHITFS